MSHLFHRRSTSRRANGIPTLATNFQGPANGVANVEMTLKWNPADLGYGCTFPNATEVFQMNWWVHRADNVGTANLILYEPKLLGGNVSSHNSTAGLIWKPTIADIDIGAPPIHNGSHQFAWEWYANNTGLEPNKVAARCYSGGFNVVDPVGVVSGSPLNISVTGTTTSTATPNPSSSISSTPSAQPSAHVTARAPQALAIGLSVSLGSLALILLVVSLWFWLVRYRKFESTKESLQKVDEELILRPEIDSTEVPRYKFPVEVSAAGISDRKVTYEMDAPVRTVEVGAVERQTLELQEMDGTGIARREIPSIPDGSQQRDAN
ncbi:hypothetical protein BGZ60DRAFT_560015 [Tricladium varicosporioides]|nr:hypothetical protein BGZ60DRAFT_560015 [Hymenoscyphus varicosporioides]